MMLEENSINGELTIGGQKARAGNSKRKERARVFFGFATAR